uniref:Uncharacterized protein n=1 Tax=Panstrongylus lignarius TaxID=156445 RepID=A0A224XRZ3_9HEMI
MWLSIFFSMMYAISFSFTRVTTIFAWSWSTRVCFIMIGLIFLLFLYKFFYVFSKTRWCLRTIIVFHSNSSLHLCQSLFEWCGSFWCT